MLGHLLNLLSRSFSAIPSSLGSNWLGIVFPIILVIIGEVIACALFGWNVVIDNWRKATGVGFAALGLCYTGLFAWCVVRTVYTDHVVLNARIKELRYSVDVNQTHENIAVTTVRERMGEQLAELRQSCAEIKGANGELQKRAGDQQGVVNNCLDRAQKLLTPIPEKTTLLIYSDDVLNGVDHKATFLLLTNSVITPVNMLVSCDAQITTGQVSVVGVGSSMMMSAEVKHGLLQIAVGSPAWTPETPLKIDVSYTSSRTANCVFTRGGRISGN